VLPDAGQVRLGNGVVIQSGATRDFDVKVVTLTGQLTVNGAVMANDTIVDGYHRGGIRFVDTITGVEIAATLGETGAALYDLKLFGSSYDVYLQARDSDYQSVLPDAGRVRLAAGCP
jgi:hypothetical protein